jgi:hypothetical protein
LLVAYLQDAALSTLRHFLAQLEPHLLQGGKLTELKTARKMLERGMVILLKLNWLDTLDLKFFFLK